MKYYLAFYQNKNKLNPFAKSIMWTENRNSSHVEVLEVVDDDFESATSYGSVFPKSRSIKFKEITKHYKCVRVIPLIVKTPADTTYLILQEKLGKYYSFGQIFMIGIKILFFSQSKWFSKIKTNVSKFLICTEYAGLFMEEACFYTLPCSADLLSLDEIEATALNYLSKDG